jgi:FKBP-type peptidyl-prolyl cis-trans isomerase SlyD
MSQNSSGQSVKTIRLIFTLESEDEIFDGAPAEKPLELVLGSGRLSPPIEALLETVEAGSDFDFHLDESLAFGAPKSELRFDVARSKLPANLREIQVGMYFDTLGPDKKLHRFRVIEANEFRVSIDGNHPLAGQSLRFRGKILGFVS